MGMSKTLTMMLGITGALVVFLVFVIGSVMAQASIENDCPDYCDTKLDVLYLKGVWDDKLRECVYAYEEPCKYGCEDDTRISFKPACKDFPDEPPENQTELDSTTWEMLKKLYDKDRKGAKLSVHGTEYQTGENGTIFLQLSDSNNNIIDDGFCELSVYYPNETNKFMDRYPMAYLENGLYFVDFTVPNELGVYMIHAYCYYSSIQHYFTLPYDVDYNGNLYEGSTGDTAEVEDVDCVFMKTENSRYHEYVFNDTEIGNINLSEITSIDLVWAGQNEVDAHVQAYNYNTASWDSVGGTIGYYFGEDCEYTRAVTRSITSGFSDYVSGDEFRFRVYLTVAGKKIWTDNADVVFHNNGSVISDIRGSGELHVSDINANINQTLIAESVWNYSNRNLTYFNYTPIIDRVDLLEINIANNFTEILSRLSEINTTTQSTYSWVQGLNNLSASDVWTYSNRTLTDYNFTELLDYLDQINQTSYAIRAFQLNELSDNLTQINLLLGDIYQTANDTYDWVTGLSNLTAQEVWSYGNRNLTYTEDVTNYALVQAYVWNATNRSINYTPIYDRIDSLNATLLQAIAESNVTLYNAIASSNSSILARVDAHNNTIMTRLYLMQGEIASVNDSINSLNNLSAYDIWNYTSRELTSFDFEVEINDTDILNAISDSNASIIGVMDAHNNTIMSKLYLIQDDLDDIEDKEDLILGDIADVQSTADDIYNTTNEIWLLVWNLTVGNVSVSANVNWTEGTVEMSNITKPEVLESQFLTFASSTSPGESVTRSYCLDNTTLIHEINTTKCIFGECFDMSDQLPITCEYGCYQNKCNPEPINKFLMILVFLFGVVIVIVVIALAYNRWG